MTKTARKWLPLALIAVALVASAVAYSRLPQMVHLRLEGVLPFSDPQLSGPAPRWLLLFSTPALALALWMAFRLAPTTAGQRLARRMFRHAPDEVTSPAQFERFDEAYDTIVLAVVILILGVHAAVLAAVLQAPGIASRILPVALGGCLVLIGNVTPRLRPNWVAGLRTKRMLGDPQLWRSAHRPFGAALVVSGLLTIMTAVAAPRYGLLVGIALLLVSLLVGLIASGRKDGVGSYTVL